VIVQHPAVENRTDATNGRADQGGQTPFGVVERRLREEARLEGVRLTAREMAHLLNNDLAVAMGCVDLLQAQADLPPDLAELIRGAARSLDAAALHIEQLQRVSRVVVKETPAGPSLDLERSRRS
jgi:signal transduction histidine kinase